jgi:hypothetical protein
MSAGLWIIAIIFSFIETKYFGWNWTAQSDAEMICDGIALLLFGLAMIAQIISAKP